MTEPLRTVVVGFGGVASSLGSDPRLARYFNYPTHAKVLVHHPAFSWQAVVDISDTALARARKEWNIPICVHDVDELIEVFDPEIAVITAPSRFRTDIVQSLPSLRAVIIEKPLSLSRSEAAEFLESCARRNLLVQVNYWRRAAAGLRNLAGDHLTALIGHPQNIFATYGNGLFNNGSHIVDLVRMLFGNVSDVYATGTTARYRNMSLEGDVQLPFVLRLTSGAVVFVASLDYRHYREAGVDVWGSEGRLTIFQESLTVHHYPRRPNRGITNEKEIASDCGRYVDCPVSDAFYDLYDNLANSIFDGAELWSSGDSAFGSEIVLHALIESAERGTPVTLDGYL